MYGFCQNKHIWIWIELNFTIFSDIGNAIPDELYGISAHVMPPDLWKVIQTNIA